MSPSKLSELKVRHPHGMDAASQGIEDAGIWSLRTVYQGDSVRSAGKRYVGLIIRMNKVQRNTIGERRKV